MLPFAEVTVATGKDFGREFRVLQKFTKHSFIRDNFQ